MSHTLIELTNRINAHPAPLLFLDTCTILDLIRIPYREELHPNMIGAAKRLLSKTASQPPQLWVVVTDQVETEWQRHQSEETDKLKKNIKDCQDKLTRFSHVLQQVLATTYPIDLTQFSLETHLLDLSKKILDVSLKIAEEKYLRYRGTTESMHV